MAAQNAAAPDRILLSAWNRDYRLSLAIIVAGIVMLVAISSFGFWATSTGNFPTSLGGGLAIYLIGTAGFMLIVLGGSWAYTNRRLLQLSGRNP
jgi:hypothetical protein